MKKYLIFFMAVVSTSFFMGCDSNEDDLEGGSFNFVSFESLDPGVNLVVPEGSSVTGEIAVYTSNVTGADRTFSIILPDSIPDEDNDGEYIVNSLDEAALTFPETVTVPAGTNKATITIKITDTEVDNTGETLILRLQEEPGFFTGDPLVIDIARFCPFDAAASGWIGTYDVSEVFTGGANAGLSLAAAFAESYQVELLENPNDPTGASVVLQNSEGFNQYFVDGTVLYFNACAGAVALSNGDLAAGFGTLTITDSSFDSTTNTITVNGALGDYGPYQFVLTKQ